MLLIAQGNETALAESASAVRHVDGVPLLYPSWERWFDDTDRAVR